MSFSIIIPSKTPENASACVASIIASQRGTPKEPGTPVRVVWDGDLIPFIAKPGNGVYVSLIPGVKPFVFARNVNLGIDAAIAEGDDAVVIVNDDTTLLEPFGYSWLVRHALDHPEFGVISAGITQHVGNPEQLKLPGTRLRALKNSKTLAFVAVCITRKTLEQIGPLDERFTAYGWEDNDYCLRCRQTGLKLGVFDGCVVEHGVLPSTFRAGNRAGDIEPGRKIFIEKWGSDSL